MDAGFADAAPLDTGDLDAGFADALDPGDAAPDLDAATADAGAVDAMAGDAELEPSGWTRVTSPTTVNLRAIYGTSDNFVMAVGDNGTVLVWNGSMWTALSNVPTTEDLYGVWGESPQSMYISGEGGTILRYDGNTFTSIGPGGTTNFRGIHGSSTTIFAVALARVENVAFRITSQAATQEMTGATGAMYGTYVTGNEIFIAGIQGAIFHYRGGWTRMTSNITEWITDLWGTSPQNVFASGRAGNILRFDGTSWQPEVVPTTAHVRGLFGRSNGTELWAVGYDTRIQSTRGGFVLRRGSGGWIRQAIPESPNLWDVWGSDTGPFWAVGFGGVILRGP